MPSKPDLNKTEPPSAGHVLRDRIRHVVTAQAGFFGLVLVAGLYLALGLPGLGRHGLWDPWEMDRAAIARQMAGPPKVLVVEASGDDGFGPMARWLHLRYGDKLVLATPEPGPRGAAAGSGRELEKAHARLADEVFHTLILDLGVAVTDPHSGPQVEELAGWLESVRAKNPGMQIVLTAPLPKDAATLDDYASALRATWTGVRVELAVRELGGKSWGRPGDVRRALTKALLDAANAGYSPLRDVLPKPTAKGNFLDAGFWTAAEKRRLDGQMARPVDPAVVEAVAALPEFQLAEPIAFWPAGADFDALIADFQAGEGAQATARAEVRDAALAFEDRVDESFGRPWLQAQFKRDGQAWSVPPLDSWLMAASFSALGFSELACRLPGFLVGLLGLLLAFRVVRRLYGPIPATLAGVVLATMPLFFAQARSASGEITFTTALIACAGGLALAADAGRLAGRHLALILAGAAAAFLSQGLFGLVVPAALAVAYLAIARDVRLSVLVPTLILVLASVLAWLAIRGAPPDSFWHHFHLASPLRGWKLPTADRHVWLNFDVLVREIGFGAAPWSILLPFGFGMLAFDAAREQRRAALVLLLWIAVPYIVQSILLKDNNHFVYPAIPAAAIAVGLLLHRVLEGRPLGALAGFAAVLLLGVLLANARKSPEPLTAFLTSDPPLAGNKAETYPEALKLPGLLKLAFAMVAALMLLHAGRLSTHVRRVISFFARPWPLFISLALVAAALGVHVLSGLESEIAQGFGTRTGQMLEPVHRVFVRSVFYWRPEAWALLVLAAGAEVAVLACHTRFFPWLWRWLTTWIFTPYVAGTLALFCALGALAVALDGVPDALAALTEKHVPELVGLGLGLAFAVRGATGRRDGAALLGGLGLAILFSLTSDIKATVALVVAPVMGLVGAFLRRPAWLTGPRLAAVGGSAALASWVEPATSAAGAIGEMLSVAVLIVSLLSAFGLVDWARRSLPFRLGLGAEFPPFAVFTLGAFTTTAVLALVAPVLSPAPDPIVTALMTVALLLGAAPLAAHWVRAHREAIARVARSAFDGVGVLWRWARNAPLLSRLALGLGLLAFVLAVALGASPEGALLGVTVKSAGFWALVAAAGVMVWRRGPLDAGATLAIGAVFAISALRLLVASDVAMLAFGPTDGLPEDAVAGRGLSLALFSVSVLALATIWHAAVRQLPRGTPGSLWLHAAAGLGALALSLGVLLDHGVFPPGFARWATLESPAFAAGLAALAVWTALALVARLSPAVFPDASLFAGIRRLGEPRVAIFGALALAGATAAACAAQLLKESGLSMAEFSIAEPGHAISLLNRNRGLFAAGLVAVAALALLSALWPALRRRVQTAHLVGIGAGVALVVVMAVPLVRKWAQLEPAVEEPGAEPFLPYLFALSRRTQVLYAAFGLLAVIGIGSRLGALGSRLRALRPAREALVLLGVALVAAVSLAALGALPMKALALAAVAFVAGAAALALNYYRDIVRRSLATLREPGTTIFAAVALAIVGLSAALASPAGVAMSLAPVVALILRALRPPPPPLSDTPATTAALLQRGAMQILIGWLAIALPVAAAFALGVGQDAAMTLLKSGLFALAVYLGAWALVVSIRFGLGVADLLDRHRMAAPAALVFTLVAAASLMMSGGGQAPALRDLPSSSLALLALAVLGEVFLAANAIAAAVPPLRALELLERPRVFVPSLALLVALVAFFYNQQLVNALSFHVSQKHLIESVDQAEGGTRDPKRLFQHGIGGRSAVNFYTKDIPEVKEMSSALKALAGEHDEVLSLTEAGASTTTFRVVQGFSAENDQDGDGRRDAPADAGIATRADPAAHWIEDPLKHWTPSEWKGSTLTDSDGYTFPVVDNTETRVVYDPAGVRPPETLAAGDAKHTAPTFDDWPSPRNHYTLDRLGRVKDATAMARSRVYFLLPKVGSHAPAYSDRGSFSELNFNFRKHSGGRFLPVLDDRSSKILLATSWLKEGEVDRNWLKGSIVTDAEFTDLVAKGLMRGPSKQKPLDGIINWEDSIHLLGWRMDSYAVSRGKKYKLYMYFKTLKPVATSMKIFMHVDRAGNRIASDHWPLAISPGPEDGKFCIGCFQTDHWLPGDIVVDVFEKEVPFGAPTGETEFWMGLYNPQNDKRMKIVGWDDKQVRYPGGDDRARIGAFVVR